MLRRSLGALWIGLLVGCGPSQPGPKPDDPARGVQQRRADPEARLRTLVEEVVALADGTECAAFGGSLTRWTDEHAAEIEQLIGALATARDEATLAELDGYVETRRLVVLEAAADCGEFEDAWPAWQHFEAMVDAARE